MFTAFLATVASQARSGCGPMEFKGIISVPLISSNLFQRDDLCSFNQLESLFSSIEEISFLLYSKHALMLPVNKLWLVLVCMVTSS